MPSLTVKVVAELMNVPESQYSRILKPYKYPDGNPRIPFYGKALSTIKDFYYSGGSPTILTDTIRSLRREYPAGRTGKDKYKRTMILNNIRVISSFSNSQLCDSALTIQKHIPRYRCDIGDIQIKFSPELIFTNGPIPDFTVLDFKDSVLPIERVQDTLELAHYVLKSGGIYVPLSSVQYFSIDSNALQQFHNSRKDFWQRLVETAELISNIWPAV